MRLIETTCRKCGKLSTFADHQRDDQKRFLRLNCYIKFCKAKIKVLKKQSQ